MTPFARIQAAIELCTTIIETPRVPADKIVNSYFREKRYIGSKDRRSVAQICYTALRYAPRYERFATLKNVLCGRMLVLLILKYEMGHTIYEIDELCSGYTYAPDCLSQQEKALLEAELAFTAAETQGLPADLYPLFQKSLTDEDVAAFAKTTFDEAPVDLRVNTLRMTRAGVLTALVCEGFDATETPHSPLGIRLQHRQSLEGHELFKSGVIEVQDEGSQLLALSCQVKSGMTVLDYCAGAGGKTLTLAAEMKNKGQIYACDIHEWRLKRAKERVKRAGVHNVRFQLADDSKFMKRHKRYFDRVLVDAPCSGTGTWRRNPDLKIRTKMSDVDELIQVQRSILTKVASLVAEGGQLIYGTCSVLRCENQDQVQWFLETFPQFEAVRVVPPPVFEENEWGELVQVDMKEPTLYQTLLERQELSLTEGQESLAEGQEPPIKPLGVSLLPHQFGTDGFYVCVLQKRFSVAESAAEKPILEHA